MRRVAEEINLIPIEIEEGTNQIDQEMAAGGVTTSDEGVCMTYHWYDSVMHTNGRSSSEL